MALSQNRFVVLAPLMMFCLFAATRPTHGQPEAPKPTLPRYQMSEDLRKAREHFWRLFMKDDVAEGATQDAVVALLEEQEQALDPLRLQAKRLAQAVASKDVPDAQIGTMLQELRAALKTEQGRRTVALTEMNAKIHYDQDPRLETALLFFGVVGDEAGVLDAVPQALRRLRVQTVPDAMKVLGLADPQDQKIAIRYVVAQEMLFRSSLVWTKQAKQFFATSPTPPTDEARRLFLSQFRDRVGELHARSQKALIKLDAAIGYTKKPRLEASLFLMGVLGDEATILNGFNASGFFGFTRLNDVITGEEVTR
jgi:hypothetical protein